MSPENTARFVPLLYQRCVWDFGAASKETTFLQDRTGRGRKTNYGQIAVRESANLRAQTYEGNANIRSKNPEFLLPSRRFVTESSRWLPIIAV